MSKYKIVTSNKFEKSVKLCIKRGYDMRRLAQVVNLLEETGAQLPAKYKQHKLTGNYAGCWECHIQPDWLLVWRQNDTELILLFVDTGTHSDIFK